MRNEKVVACALASAAGVAVSVASAGEPPARATLERELERAVQEGGDLIHRPPVKVLSESDENAQGVGGEPPALFPWTFRTIDGTNNNPSRPNWGAAGSALLRTVPAQYGGDGSGDVPGGAGRPSARAISNAVHAQSGMMPNPQGVSDYLWQWGQFLDHDLDEAPIASPAEAFNILVPMGDPFFDPASTGTAVIALNRSAGVDRDGVRQQLNNLTAFIDASMVYGSEEDVAHELRALDGTGRLRTSDGDLLPFNTGGFPNAPTANDPTLFLAGDVRANEQAGLTAIHTLFVREHNYWAQRWATSFPWLSEDELYEFSRAMVAAEVQAITYREFLPLLLGKDALPPYQGFNPNVNPGVTNEFATAAYRVGHTMLSPRIVRVDADGNDIPDGPLPLMDAFFNPALTIENGIEPVLRGLASQRAQIIDRHVVDDVRNFLFGPPGAGGLDLPSLNIQRGREHGLPSYNQVRVAFGRTPAMNFAEVNPDPGVAGALASVYANPAQIDLWTGLLSEPHRPGALVGETLFRVLRDQFTRARDGDRFYYERYLPPYLVAEVEDTTLGDIIRRNTPADSVIGDDVFHVAGANCPADLDGDGDADINDVIAFVQAFIAWDAAADVNDDGAVNVNDVLDFLQSFSAGC